METISRKKVGSLDYNHADSVTTNLGNLGTTETIDFDTGTNFRGTLDDDVTIIISNLTDGQRGTVSLYYSGAQRTVTLSGVKLPVDGLPDAPSSADEVLVLTVWRDGVNSFVSGQLFDVS